MKRHDAARSGNCHEVRMLLAQLDLPHEIVSVDLAAGEHRTPAYLALNPRGQVPPLEDEGEVIWDSHAIPVYPARRHGGQAWLPRAPLAPQAGLQLDAYPALGAWLGRIQALARYVGMPDMVAVGG